MSDPTEEGDVMDFDADDFVDVDWGELDKAWAKEQYQLVDKLTNAQLNQLVDAVDGIVDTMDRHQKIVAYVRFLAGIGLRVAQIS